MSEMTDFEAGAFWALGLLQVQLRDRSDALRRIALPDEEAAQAVGVIRNVMASVQSKYEIAFTPGLRLELKQRAARSEGRKDGAR